MRRFIHEPPIPHAEIHPIIEVAPSSPFGYRLRVNGREVGPKIAASKVAEYLQGWLESAWEDLHHG